MLWNRVIAAYFRSFRDEYLVGVVAIFMHFRLQIQLPFSLYLAARHRLQWDSPGIPRPITAIPKPLADCKHMPILYTVLVGIGLLSQTRASPHGSLGAVGWMLDDDVTPILLCVGAWEITRACVGGYRILLRWFFLPMSRRSRGWDKMLYIASAAVHRNQ